MRLEIHGRKMWFWYAGKTKGMIKQENSGWEALDMQSFVWSDFNH
jgi:hypothetical protein